MSVRIETFYIPGDSFFHELDPRTKLVWAIAMMVISFLFFNPTVPLILLVLNFTILILAIGSSAIKNFITNTLLVFAIPQILFHGCVNVIGKTPVMLNGQAVTIPLLGPLKWEGLYFGSVFAFRVLLMGYATMLFISTTHPRDVVKGFEKLGMPFRYSFMMLMSLQLIPSAIREVSTIINAQKSRGVRMKSPIERARAVLPLFIPIAVGSIQRVQLISMSLEARAYGAPVTRTELRELNLRVRDLLILALLTIITLLSATFRLTAGDLNWIADARSLMAFFFPR